MESPLYTGNSTCFCSGLCPFGVPDLLLACTSQEIPQSVSLLSLGIGGAGLLELAVLLGTPCFFSCVDFDVLTCKINIPIHTYVKRTITIAWGGGIHVVWPLKNDEWGIFDRSRLEQRMR